MVVRAVWQIKHERLGREGNTAQGQNYYARFR